MSGYRVEAAAAVVCEACGALVADTDAHDRFHARLARSSSRRQTTVTK